MAKYDPETGEEYCPKCYGEFRGDLLEDEVQVLRSPRGANALSRRDNKTLICRLCGLAEGFADLYGGMTDIMARRVVQNELNEVARLGEGTVSYLGVMYRPGERVKGGWSGPPKRRLQSGRWSGDRVEGDPSVGADL